MGNLVACTAQAAQKAGSGLFSSYVFPPVSFFSSFSSGFEQNEREIKECLEFFLFV